LGGRFTTLEGILDQVYEELSEKVFNTGDSGVIDTDDRAEFQEFLRKLKQACLLFFLRMTLILIGVIRSRMPRYHSR